MIVKFRVQAEGFASYVKAERPKLAMRQLYLRMKFEGSVPAGTNFLKLSKDWSCEPAHRQPAIGGAE